MGGNEEKARRKQILHSVREKERQNIRETFPATATELKAFFDSLDVQLSESDCDHTLRFTREYIRQHAMDENRIIQWLENLGGYCDCEVLDNVEPVVSDAVLDYGQIHGQANNGN